MGSQHEKKNDNGLWIVDQPGSANVLRCTLVNQFRPLASNKDWIISGDDLASSLERLPCQPCQASPTLGSWATEAKSPRFVSIKIARGTCPWKAAPFESNYISMFMNVYELESYASYASGLFLDGSVAWWGSMLLAPIWTLKNCFGLPEVKAFKGLLYTCLHSTQFTQMQSSRSCFFPHWRRHPSNPAADFLVGNLASRGCWLRWNVHCIVGARTNCLPDCLFCQSGFGWFPAGCCCIDLLVLPLAWLPGAQCKDRLVVANNARLDQKLYVMSCSCHTSLLCSLNFLHLGMVWSFRAGMTHEMCLHSAGLWLRLSYSKCLGVGKPPSICLSLIVPMLAAMNQSDFHVLSVQDSVFCQIKTLHLHLKADSPDNVSESEPIL